MNGKPPQNKRKDIAMKYVHFFCITYFVFTIIGCGKKHHEQVEINVSDSFKKAIEEVAPKKKYCFYALKESYPKSIEEMTQTKLIVCGDIEEHADLTIVMTASIDGLDVPLFKSISRYLISPFFLSGGADATETLSITSQSGETFEVVRKKRIYAKDTSISVLISECFEELKNNDKSVLFMSKDVDSEQLNHMVKLVFE